MNISCDQRLKRFRKGANLSQRQLAAALGVSQSFVGNIESGRSEPSRNFLLALSEHFRVNPAWILEGRDPMVFDLPNPDMPPRAQPAPPRGIDMFLFMFCENAVSQEYAAAAKDLDKVAHLSEVAWFYNELLARLADPTDGDEVEATMPQVRHLLRKKFNAPEASVKPTKTPR